MGRYVVREAEEYYDMNECDARGYPVKKIRYTGVEYETTVDPEGDYVESGPDGWEIHTVIVQKEVQAPPLTLYKNSLNLIVGEENYVTHPDNHSYSVESSDEAVATAEEKGFYVWIKAVGKGTATITVKDIKSGQKATVTVTVIPLCPDGNHPHMIDLGLPSGTKWACCNVGATKPEEYGGNYAWEEMKDWGNDTHCDELLKETNRDIANTKHDVAHVKWDGNWQIPSIKQIRELLENCESEWARLNGARGRKFTSKINGNSIFLCAGGNFGDYFPGCGYYLSSTLSSSNKDRIWGLSFDPSYADCIAGFSRQQGYKIRPVSR